MRERRRPTLRDAMARTERGIIDDTVVTIRPSPEERAARRAEAEAFLAEQGARRRPDATQRRSAARRRTPA